MRRHKAIKYSATALFFVLTAMSAGRCDEPIAVTPSPTSASVNTSEAGVREAMSPQVQQTQQQSAPAPTDSAWTAKQVEQIRQQYKSGPENPGGDIAEGQVLGAPPKPRRPDPSRPAGGPETWIYAGQAQPLDQPQAAPQQAPAQPQMPQGNPFDATWGNPPLQAPSQQQTPVQTAPNYFDQFDTRQTPADMSQGQQPLTATPESTQEIGPQPLQTQPEFQGGSNSSNVSKQKEAEISPDRITGSPAIAWALLILCISSGLFSWAKKDNRVANICLKALKLSSATVATSSIIILTVGLVGSGIWLMLFGKWAALVLGVLIMLFAHFGLGLLLLLDLPLRLAVYLESRRPFLSMASLAVWNLYIDIARTLWCVCVFQFFFGPVDESAKIPMYLWCYGAATIPWLIMASFDAADSLSAAVGKLTLEVACILLLISHIFWHPSFVISLVLAGSVMALGFISVTLIAFRLVRENEGEGQGPGPSSKGAVSRSSNSSISGQASPGYEKQLPSVGAGVIWTGLIFAPSLIHFLATGLMSSNPLDPWPGLNPGAFLFFYFALYRIHKVVGRATNGSYSIKTMKLLLVLIPTKLFTVPLIISALALAGENQTMLAMAIGIVSAVFASWMLYWEYRWPQQIVVFVNNHANPGEKISPLAPSVVNVLAVLVGLFASFPFGLLIAFSNLFYLNNKLRATLGSGQKAEKVIIKEGRTDELSTEKISNDLDQTEPWLSYWPHHTTVAPVLSTPADLAHSPRTANAAQVDNARPIEAPHILTIASEPVGQIDCSPRVTASATTTHPMIRDYGLNKVQEFGEIIDIFRAHGFNVDIGILEPWATEEAIFQNIKLTHSQHVAAEEAYGQYTPDEILDSDYTPELSAENREAVAYQKQLHDDIVRTMNEWHDNVRRQVADGKEIRERRLGRALRAMKVIHGEAPHPNSHEAADLLALGEQVRKFSRHTIRFSSDINVRQVLTEFIEGEYTSLPGANALSSTAAS